MPDRRRSEASFANPLLPNPEPQGKDDGHQIRFVISDGRLRLELQHPRSGKCPATFDGDTQISGECFLTSWFEALEPDELLHGEVAFWAPMTWEVLYNEEEAPIVRIGPKR